METTLDTEILQVHYYLNNGSHSMDAKILNKVERELLKIVEEVAGILDLEIFVETYALEEGGIKSIYKFLNKKKNRAKIVIVGSFLASILGSVISDVISDSIKTDPESERLKKQFLELQIKKLKQDFEKDSIASQHISNSESEENTKDFIVTPEFIDSIAVYISENNKVKLSKSKFYEFLLKEGKVEKVSTQELNENFEPKSVEKVVPRSDFKLFIVKDAVIEPDYKENVTLEIVSPVLKRNRMSWKAIYNDHNITFSLKDDDFKKLIVNKNLSFSNGTKILCDIETKQKMNDDGEILEAGKTVYNVYKIIYPNGDIVDLK